MNHAESCATCGSFWLELQAAQKLSLSLQQAETSSNFREGLWDRINAGEGTPSAVFQEQVPLWSKVRYALTGAAAAAALLIGVTFLTKDNAVTPNITDVANSNNGGASSDGTANDLTPSGTMTGDLASNGEHGTLEPRRSHQPQNQSQNSYQYPQPPLMAAATPLSTQVLAVETARQFEQRYASAAIGLRMMQNPENNRASYITQVVNSAREMRDFGELLMELRESQGLSFLDASIDADLQYAVSMLEKVGALSTPSEQMVKVIIEPVLTKSGRLAHVSRSISLRPTTDIHTELSYLRRFTLMRPDVFSKLFVVLGRPDQMRPSTVFLLESDCDTGWVAPRSQIQRLKIK
ncbi:MAG: hypothetical protein ACI91B_001192 [Planctomycetota bacterium]|jgi:hypothetical protein